MKKHACVCFCLFWFAGYCSPNTIELLQQQPRPAPLSEKKRREMRKRKKKKEEEQEEQEQEEKEEEERRRKKKKKKDFSTAPLVNQREAYNERWGLGFPVGNICRSKVKRPTWEYISLTTELEDTSTKEKQLNHSHEINHDPFLGVIRLIDPCAGTWTLLHSRVNRRQMLHFPSLAQMYQRSFAQVTHRRLISRTRLQDYRSISLVCFLNVKDMKTDFIPALVSRSGGARGARRQLAYQSEA